MSKLFFTTILVSFLYSFSATAQGLLDRRVSIEANRQRLDDVLSILANKGGFSFSYNSNIVKRDSLVSISASNRTVRQVLNQLLSNTYEYKESGNYIILRRVALQLTTIEKKVAVEERTYTISGYIVNSETGERVPYASIYEREHLVSALSDLNGNFSIRLKSRHKAASLAISRDAYEDTMVQIEPRFDMQLVIAIVPEIKEVYTSTPNVYERVDTSALNFPDIQDTPVVAAAVQDEKPTRPPAPDEVEKTGMGKFLLSAKQKIRSLNLKKFFTEKPFQLGVIPGVSTQGKMSSQVINNFSLNVLGGYTGGVKGAEFAGLFNLNRKDMRYLQLAGLFNITGGSALGLQAGGIHNNVLRQFTGLQLSGVSNYVKNKMTGLQAAGVYNHVADTVSGMQVAGLANYARKKVNGVQVAGFANFSNRAMKGVQIAGIFNYAKRMKGVQIGLINVSDSIDGYSIGLVNIVFKGYHKLSFSTNEVVDANVSFKTGSRHFYNILQAGMQVRNRAENKMWTFGYGLGTELNLGKLASVNPELTSQYLYLGTWDHLNLLSKLTLNLNIRLGKRLALFGGPSFNVYYTDQTIPVAGYKLELLPADYHTFDIGIDKTRSWIGWNAGISFF